MSRLFITGDIHGSLKDIKRIKEFCKQAETTKEDGMIILGDVGANYWLDERDLQVKEALSSCPITFLCIHGNHEERPENIKTYEYFENESYDGLWFEYDYPNIFFLRDGEHILNGKRFLVASGAYSIDKKYRLATGKRWFASEQMDDDTKKRLAKLITENNSFDYILSHTAPLNYEPKYLFLSMIDQDTVDKSMENYLQWIYENIDLDKLNCWFLGHYHSDELLSNKIRLMYNDIIEIE